MVMAVASDTAFSDGAFAALMEAWQPRLAGRGLAVAVSGGADSMALCLLMQRWADAHDATLTALIVDHGLRLESAEEAQLVQGWLSARHIAAHILVPANPITGNGLQEKARDARYRLMIGWCRDHDVKHLFTAHHAGDQLETVLMHLVRGSGVEGLAGIPPESERGGVCLLRPLLAIPKTALQHYLLQAGQGWVEDPTNRKPQFARNRMRDVAEILEREGLTPARLAETTRLLRQAGESLQTRADQLLRRMEWSPAGYVGMPYELWQEMDAEIAYRALRLLVKHLRPHTNIPRAETLHPIAESLRRGECQKPITFAGLLLTPHAPSNRILLSREPSRLAEDKNISNDQTMVWDDRFAVRLTKEFPSPLSIGGLGAEGVAALPPQTRRDLDRFRLPKRVIYGFPALKGLEGVLAVPHIGYQSVTGLLESVEIAYLPLKTLAADADPWFIANGMETEPNA